MYQNQKKDLCRNFQRGHCQFGSRCRFSHASPIQQQQQQQQQQQPPKSNPFGFGSVKNSPQPNNPFGFGSLSSNSQPKPPAFGSNQQNQNQNQNQNQFKPFENKWTRPGAKQTANQAQSQASTASASEHHCTDPGSCKRQIVEDEPERPIWKLTCYAHNKYLPCDIVGDISYEELRAIAYDDAKRGLPLSAIVERERNLYLTKVHEFENLVRNPYVKPNAVPGGLTPFPGTNNVSGGAVPFPGSINVSGGPAPFPGSNNVSGGPAPFPGSNNASGGSTPFPGSNVTGGSTPFPGSNSGPPSVVPPSVSSFSHLGVSTNQGSSASFPAPANSFGTVGGGFGVGPSAFGTPDRGLFGGQQSSHVINSANSQVNSGSAALVHFPSFASSQPPVVSIGQNAAGSLVGQPSMYNRSENIPEALRIWLKDAWNPGEIPEEAPPVEFVWKTTAEGFWLETVTTQDFLLRSDTNHI